MRLSNLKIRTKIFMVAGVPLLMAAAIAGVSLWAFAQVESVEGWVSHTNEVLSTAEVIVASAADMESGMRGFAISGEEPFLEPYVNGKKMFAETIQLLQQTVSDNPPQVERLKQANEVILNWEINVAEAQVTMRRTVGVTATMDDVVTFAANAGGKAYFDQFRAIMSEFTDTESALLVSRQAESASTRSMAVTSIIGGLVAAIIAGGGAALRRMR